jgi:twinkle protein
MADFLRHVPCPHCDSSDGNAEYTDGTFFCHVCDTYTHSNNRTEKRKDNVVPLPKTKELPNLEHSKTGPLVERRITKATVEHYDVKLDLNRDGIVTHHHYPYTTLDGDVIAYKTREVTNKDFRASGSINKSVLFGQAKFSKEGKFVTLCEGEIDTLATFQMNGSKFPVVGVKSSSQAYKDCKAQFEWLDTFENIIVCFDSDDPGKKAAKEVASLFPKKAKIVKLSDKFNDAGKYLELSKEADFTNLWWRAERYTPSDIISGAEAALAILKQPRAEAAFQYPWDGLNKMTYGLRTGEMTTLIAGSGSGKTSVSREIAYHVLKENNIDINIGMLYLEETGWETTRGLVSLDLNKPTHLPDTHTTEQELIDGTNRTWGTNRVHSLNDSWADNSIDFIGDKIKYFAKGLDCKLIILDHISFMVSDDNADERKSLDTIAHKLKALSVELDLHLLIIAHTKRVSGKPLEEGGQISLSDIRGTAGIGQLSNIVMGIERNGQSDDPIERNTTTVRVVKNRFCGRTGPACQLLYNEHTGRLTEVEKGQEDD